MRYNELPVTDFLWFRNGISDGVIRQSMDQKYYREKVASCINFVFPMLSSSGSFFVFGCRIGNICTVNIMPERTIKTEDIYHHDILRYHPRTFLFLQGPPGSFFYRLGDRLSGIGYEVRYLNISGGDVFDRPLFCRSSCFRGRPEQWENYLGEFISQKRISDIVLYDAGGFYHAAARAVSRKSGIRVWVYDTLRGFPGTVILHRDFDDDEAVVIPKNGRNQEVCERHSPASVSSGDGSMVFPALKDGWCVCQVLCGLYHPATVCVRSRRYSLRL